MGFGGACPSGYTTVKVAQGDIQACYQKNADGTESWTQMSHPLPNAGFSGRALTSNAQPASHDLILQILSTLTFAPVPAATPAGATYTDPFAYCAAAGTIDTPDARYTGPKTPGSVLPIPVGARHAVAVPRRQRVLALHGRQGLYLHGGRQHSLLGQGGHEHHAQYRHAELLQGSAQR